MKLFFDSIIAMIIAVTAFLAVILLYSRKNRDNSWEHRHKKLSLILAILCILIFLIVIYGSFVEPKLLITNYQEIDLPKIEKPIKIALVSDLQIGSYKKEKDLEKIVKRIEKLSPDIILLGGDQVDNGFGTFEDETVYLKPLKELAEKYPTFAIHGNHEYGIGGGKSITDPSARLRDFTKESKDAIEKLGIKYLVNDLVELKINEQNFYLFGGDEFWSGNLKLDKLNNKKDIPTIALIHNPTAIFQIPANKIDLMLSGHTHGGQIRLPFIGPVGRVDSILPAKWYQGLHEYQGTKFFVTSGAGETGTRARLFNPPEIVLLTIK